MNESIICFSICMCFLYIFLFPLYLICFKSSIRPSSSTVCYCSTAEYWYISFTIAPRRRSNRITPYTNNNNNKNNTISKEREYTSKTDNISRQVQNFYCYELYIILHKDDSNKNKKPYNMHNVYYSRLGCGCKKKKNKTENSLIKIISS